eukprot:TRINITY_DN12444_c0_g1_i3.p1 TRINITY_DN12444_c0_g1~~TRINITY_DN12444_c0_g1_i3.p1  ORF type:complete len:558 (+),score=89.19 TRINITY_DN12444_c0_g1_i3:112-1785(+)
MQLAPPRALQKKMVNNVAPRPGQSSAFSSRWQPLRHSLHPVQCRLRSFPFRKPPDFHSWSCTTGRRIHRHKLCSGGCLNLMQTQTMAKRSLPMVSSRGDAALSTAAGEGVDGGREEASSSEAESAVPADEAAPQHATHQTAKRNASSSTPIAERPFSDRLEAASRAATEEINGIWEGARRILRAVAGALPEWPFARGSGSPSPSSPGAPAPSPGEEGEAIASQAARRAAQLLQLSSSGSGAWWSLFFTLSLLMSAAAVVALLLCAMAPSEERKAAAVLERKPAQPRTSSHVLQSSKTVQQYLSTSQSREGTSTGCLSPVAETRRTEAPSVLRTSVPARQAFTPAMHGLTPRSASEVLCPELLVPLGNECTLLVPRFREGETFEVATITGAVVVRLTSVKPIAAVVPHSERIIAAPVLARLSFSDGEGRLLMHCSIAKPLVQPQGFRRHWKASGSGSGWTFHIQRSNGLDFAKLSTGGPRDARYILETVAGDKLFFLHSKASRSLNIADEDGNLLSRCEAITEHASAHLCKLRVGPLMDVGLLLCSLYCIQFLANEHL